MCGGWLKETVTHTCTIGYTSSQSGNVMVSWTIMMLFTLPRLISGLTYILGR